MGSHASAAPPRILCAGRAAQGFDQAPGPGGTGGQCGELLGVEERTPHVSAFPEVRRQRGQHVPVGRPAPVGGPEGRDGPGRLARPVEGHLQALEIAHAITLVRPFDGGGPKELVRPPRVYGFDTVFVSFARRWDPVRPEDHGLLWEHVVLEHLQAHLPYLPIRYWRDKAGREVDFVLGRPRAEAGAIECRWDPSGFDPGSLEVFRSHYPREGRTISSPRTTVQPRPNDSTGWRSRDVTRRGSAPAPALDRTHSGRPRRWPGRNPRFGRRVCDGVTRPPGPTGAPRTRRRR